MFHSCIESCYTFAAVVACSTIESPTGEHRVLGTWPIVHKANAYEVNKPSPPQWHFSHHAGWGSLFRSSHVEEWVFNKCG